MFKRILINFKFLRRDPVDPDVVNTNSIVQTPQGNWLDLINYINEGLDEGLINTTFLQQGANITITGTGTSTNPYVISSVGGSGGSSATVDVVATSHGLTIPAQGFLPVRQTSATTWVAADSSASDNIQQAYAISVPNTDSLRIQQNGFLTANGHGLTIGQFYFLQDNGSIGITADSDINSVVCKVLDTNTLQLIDNRAIEFTVNDGVETITSSGNIASTTTFAIVDVTSGNLTLNIDETSVVSGYEINIKIIDPTSTGNSVTSITSAGADIYDNQSLSPGSTYTPIGGLLDGDQIYLKWDSGTNRWYVY